MRQEACRNSTARAVEDDVGLSPKHVHRINRFQRALALRRREPGLTWSAVAAQTGYHDHAHLVRNSRDIAGRTPTELLGEVSGLTEAFLADECGPLMPLTPPAET